MGTRISSERVASRTSSDCIGVTRKDGKKEVIYSDGYKGKKPKKK